MTNLASTPLTLQQFIELSPLAILQVTPDGQIINANTAFHSLTHRQLAGTLTPSLLTVLGQDDKHKLLHQLQHLSENTTPSPLQLCLRLPPQEEVIVFAYTTLMQPENSTAESIIIHLIDQTEQKQLELRFAHSQKMQAVGQLAGGVAHDFNNLLTAMIGFCDLLLMRHPAGDPSFADIMQVKQNANRAANLVRQLLAFSRRQTLQPKVLDMTDVLSELSNLISRLIGENIELNMTHGRDLGMVKADQGQLEQVIINLAVNARDAMPEGGTLSIRTNNVTVDRHGLDDKNLIAPADVEQITPGDYILTEVEDTGTGIPPEIVKSIFEPFFSTKEVGSGTGLGLSTVYGIIKQTGGYIYVRTEEGKGTTFSIYFKRQEAKLEDPLQQEEESRATDLTGGETILLVEDETPVRLFAARALRNKGYEVLEADSGEQAIEVFSQHEGDVDVIISDVIMPGMTGPKMIEQLEAEQADKIAHAEIIFISGYAEDAFVDSFGPERSFNFLPKPFTLKQLAAKVKEVIIHRSE